MVIFIFQTHKVRFFCSQFLYFQKKKKKILTLNVLYFYLFEFSTPKKRNISQKIFTYTQIL